MKMFGNLLNKDSMNLESIKKPFEKAVVRAHQRKAKSGKLSQVKQYSDSRQKKTKDLNKMRMERHKRMDGKHISLVNKFSDLKDSLKNKKGNSEKVKILNKLETLHGDISELHNHAHDALREGNLKSRNNIKKEISQKLKQSKELRNKLKELNSEKNKTLNSKTDYTKKKADDMYNKAKDEQMKKDMKGGKVNNEKDKKQSFKIDESDIDYKKDENDLFPSLQKYVQNHFFVTGKFSFKNRKYSYKIFLSKETKANRKKYNSDEIEKDSVKRGDRKVVSVGGHNVMILYRPKIEQNYRSISPGFMKKKMGDEEYNNLLTSLWEDALKHYKNIEK